APNDPQHLANTVLEVAASDLDSVWLRGGQASGSDTMWVRAFDGKDWGNWDQFTLTTTNTQPIVTASDTSLHANTWAQIKNWIGYSDADGDAVVKYQFWDASPAADSAYFWTPSDPHVAANTTLDVAAADLANVWIRGGQSDGITDTMWVRAFDGSTWSNWD